MIKSRTDLVVTVLGLLGAFVAGASLVFSWAMRVMRMMKAGDI